MKDIRISCASKKDWIDGEWAPFWGGWNGNRGKQVMPVGRIFLSSSLSLIVFFTVWGAVADKAMAHRVSVFAFQEGDTIRVEAKFAGGRKVKDGRIIIFDQDGKLLHEGATDQDGIYAFKRPSPGALKVVVEAGQGHRGEWSMEALEKGPSTQVAEVKKNTEKGEVAPVISQDEIMRMIEESVEKNIRPLKDLILASREEGSSLRDILGGIGYIIGLVGLAAYFRGRYHYSGGKDR